MALRKKEDGAASYQLDHILKQDDENFSNVILSSAMARTKSNTITPKVEATRYIEELPIQKILELHAPFETDLRSRISPTSFSEPREAE